MQHLEVRSLVTGSIGTIHLLIARKRGPQMEITIIAILIKWFLFVYRVSIADASSVCLGNGWSGSQVGTNVAITNYPV